MLTQASHCIDIFGMTEGSCKEGFEEETKLTITPPKQLLRKIHSAAAPTDSTFFIAASKLMVPRPRPVALETRQTKLTEFFARDFKSTSK